MQIPKHSARRYLITSALLFVLAATGSPLKAANWFDRARQAIGNALPQQTHSPATLTTTEITAGLKEALNLATQAVVARLGTTDGFNLDPRFHIPLPASLARVQNALQPLGFSSLLDDLELRLNRAAEQATPAGKAIFLDAIKEMTLEDVQAIYKGPEDAATRYFESKMTPSLRDAMEPLVDREIRQAGALTAYEAVMGKYRSLPFMPDVKADLTSHVLDSGLAAIFYYLAQEEAKIRQDPARQTTALLQRLFNNGR